CGAVGRGNPDLLRAGAPGLKGDARTVGGVLGRGILLIGTEERRLRRTAGRGAEVESQQVPFAGPMGISKQVAFACNSRTIGVFTAGGQPRRCAAGSRHLPEGKLAITIR